VESIGYLYELYVIPDTKPQKYCEFAQPINTKKIGSQKLDTVD
jgi:hypothetical protein